MDVAIVILNYRCASLTIDCLQSVVRECRSGSMSVRVIVVDGASGDGSDQLLCEAIRKHQWTELVEFLGLSTNGGFSFGNNAAIERVLRQENAPKYVLLLNPDTVVCKNSLSTLHAFMEAHPQVGICGSRLENPDGTSQFAARRFPGFLSEFESTIRLGIVSRLLDGFRIIESESDNAHPTDWVPGASMMIRTSVFDAIGLLDDRYFMYFEEVDFCLRAKRAGWSIWYVPESRVTHFVGQVSGVTSYGQKKRRPAYWFDSRRRYFQKNHGFFYRILADLAFISGSVMWRLRRIVQKKADDDPPRLLGDFISHSVRWKKSES